VGPRAILDVVVKKKIPSPHQELNPRTLIVHTIPTELSQLLQYKYNKYETFRLYNPPVRAKMYENVENSHF
jgi:hypothetical protein